MSERKTTEIKLRVTPAEKTAWQLAAEEEGIGLSELIRREMNARAAMRPSTVPQDFIEAARDFHRQTVARSSNPTAPIVDRLAEHLEARRSAVLSDLPVASDGGVGCSLPARALCAFPECKDGECYPRRKPPQEDVPTSDRADSVAKPWMFEARVSE